MDNYKFLYQKSLEALGNQLHFVAHSHHLWPDISFEGQKQYWFDSVKMNDHKWEYLFSEILPQTQKKIAALLDIADYRKIVMSSNTHEFVLRILSLFPSEKKIKVLTSDSEFYSFDRQINRMAEEGTFVKKISTDLLIQDRKVFIETLKKELKNNYDLLFLSQVFFNSGLALSQKEIESIVLATPEDTLICIDGYHGFAALPIDLSHLSKRIFYVGGGYKYAQSGEGMWFMIVPEGDWRPSNTGWFAELSLLAQKRNNEVLYPEGAAAFWGATLDPSSWYRFNFIWNEFEKNGITLSKIHQHVQTLQSKFLSEIKISGLIYQKEFNHGHFLTFDFKDKVDAINFVEKTKTKQILVDLRGSRVRFGFGLYQDLSDIELLLQKINKF